MQVVGLMVGVILFAVVMVVLVSNNNRISELRKAVNASASSASNAGVSAPGTSLLVRDTNGNYAPKRAYYVRVLSPTAQAFSGSVTSRVPEKPAGVGVVGQVVVRVNADVDVDGYNLARDVERGYIKTVFRPEKRVLYTVQSAMFKSDSAQSSTWQPVTPPNASAGVVATTVTNDSGYLLLNLKKNSGTGEDPMFTDGDYSSDAGTSTTGASQIVRRTIMGVPAGMAGNAVSGV